MGMRAVMTGLAALAALAAGPAPAKAGPTRGGGTLPVTCTAPAGYEAVAAQLSAGIAGALSGRAGDHAVTVYDQEAGISCTADGGLHFDSASIVKAIILAALLRWHQETGAPLSAWERDEATLMITQSDDDAATGLWDEVGMTRLQHFLDLAQMNETGLGPGGHWGLTQATAHDEMLLLQLLTGPNPVLSGTSRAYELGLMSQVTGWQRWGTPAGVPAGVTVHVKDGWLPDDTGWHVNSIGAFTRRGDSYLIAVLTDDNPSEQYGIGTIEDVARQVHQELSAARFAARVRLEANLARTAAGPAAPSPWAVVPALPLPWAVVPALPAPPL